MATTLPLFWHLSSASRKERVDASTKLIGALEQFQSQFVPKTSPETSDEDEGTDSRDQLDALNAQDVSYSIRRLVRGLASPRESSRLGFSVALTELLSRIQTVTCSQLVSLIVESSKTQGSMTGQEERDVLFARLFGLTAVIRSGLLVRSTPLQTSGSSSTTSSDSAGFQETVKLLIGLGDKKSWLRESAWWSIGLAFDALKDSSVSWQKEALEAAITLIFKEDTAWSPEKVAVALKLQRHYPDRDWKNIYQPIFKGGELLSSKSLPALARILKESTEGEDATNEARTAAGAWKPQLHYVWETILDELLPGPNSTSTGRGSFQEFFRVVVDESLFSSTSSQQRKYWGFQVFQKALPRVSAADMPMLFTRNFMRSWINHLSHRDRYLHKVAAQVAKDIHTFVEQNPHLGFSLILQLTGVNGSQQFDKLTRTKTVENILASMDTEGIVKYIDYLLEQVNEVDSKDPEKIDIAALNTKRAWILDQLHALIRNGSIPKNDEWIQSVLDWFTVHGLFIVNKKSAKSPYRAVRTIVDPPLSDELRQVCRTKLLNSLADLTGQITILKGDDKTLKVVGVTSQGELWVTKVLETIIRLQEDSKHVSSLAEVDEEDRAVRTKANDLLAQLRKASEEHKEVARGAELLVAATLIQQYCLDEHDAADGEALDACIEAARKMFPATKKSKKSRKSAGAEITEDEPEPIDVMVDIIIGFLEKSTSYLRTVANQVFALLSSSVKESTIDLILTQLERRSPAELAEDEDIEMDDEEQDEEGEEDEPSASSHSSDSEDEDDSEEEEEDNDEEAEIVRKKIEAALRANGIKADTGEGDESDEEEMMDDDAMMAIDEQLAAVFRARADEKKSSKDVDAQREATHFKNRVLDLVDTFVKKQSSSPLILRLIIPLVEVVAGTGSDEQQLADKAKGILRSRIGKSKDLPAGVDATETEPILDKLHARARKVHSSDMLATLSQCSLYVTKVLLQASHDAKVLSAYRGSLEDFMTRKNSALNVNFFQDFVRHFPSMGWALRDDLLRLSQNAANSYRRLQAFIILQTVIAQVPSLTNQTEDVKAFMPSLRSALVDLVSAACEDKALFTAPQVKELLKLGLAAVRQTKRICGAEETQAIWLPTSWTTLHGKLVSSERFRTSVALQTMCRQIGELSQQSKSSASATKSTKGNPEPETVPAKRKADAAGTPGSIKTKRKRTKKAD